MRWIPQLALALLIAGQATAAELHGAARRGDLAAVDKLLAAGAQVDAMDGGASPLYLAAEGGHANVVARLLAAGGDPRRQASGPFGSTGTAIHAAARNGHLDVVRLLLDAGVDPNLPDDGGYAGKVLAEQAYLRSVASGRQVAVNAPIVVAPPAEPAASASEPAAPEAVEEAAPKADAERIALR